MKKLYRHYKFKVLRILALLNLTFPLRYSIWNNAGIILAIFSVLNFMSEDPIIDQNLSLFTGLVGLFMGGRMLWDIYENYTIKDE